MLKHILDHCYNDIICATQPAYINIFREEWKGESWAGTLLMSNFGIHLCLIKPLFKKRFSFF